MAGVCGVDFVLAMLIDPTLPRKADVTDASVLPPSTNVWRNFVLVPCVTLDQGQVTIIQKRRNLPRVAFFADLLRCWFPWACVQRGCAQRACPG